jgi:hypothetical protein
MNDTIVESKVEFTVAQIDIAPSAVESNLINSSDNIKSDSPFQDKVSTEIVLNTSLLDMVNAFKECDIEQCVVADIRKEAESNEVYLVKKVTKESLFQIKAEQLNITTD